jgi:phosphoadenosine phosphosulfate reductase
MRLIMEELKMRAFDPVGMAIERLRQFEPPEGYYLAFSGGKDSQCIYHLAKEAGVKFDAHYNLTTVDPPELVYFIRDNYPDVIFDRPRKTMWKMVSSWGLPLRHMRFCCSELKERGGENRLTVTGVRLAESVKRAKSRAMLEKFGSDKILFNDNDDERKMIEICQTKSKRVLNPIIDWEDGDVWDYLKGSKINYCCLYDQGFSRLGCIGCPQGNTKQMIQQFKRWPKYYDAYKKAAGRWLILRHRKGKNLNLKTSQDVMDWWIYEMPKEDPSQLKMFDQDDF